MLRAVHLEAVVQIIQMLCRIYKSLFQVPRRHGKLGNTAKQSKLVQGLNSFAVIMQLLKIALQTSEEPCDSKGIAMLSSAVAAALHLSSDPHTCTCRLLKHYKMLTTRAFTGTPRLARSNGRVTGSVVVRCVAQPRRSLTASAQAQSSQNASVSSQTQLLAAGALLAPYVLDVTASLAAGGEYGLLEGRYVAV